jgi:hypothetical protein
MATYFKYAERSAEDYVDWGAIGKTMSDTLLKEEENRRKIKAKIEKDSNEFGEVLANSPQGEHRGMNEYAQEFASNAQQFQLMQLRNLKAGKLNLKDYLISRENVKQGANDAFDIIKKYNDKYGEYQQSVKDGVASKYQTHLLSEVEGFGNLTKTSLYINPTNGKVSAAFRQTQDPSKPYDPVDNPYTSKMETDPSKFRSLVDLNFALSAKIDKYDAQGAIDGIADSYAKTYEVITEKGPRGAFVVTDNITQYGEISDAEIKANFKKAKEDGYEGSFEEYSAQEKSKSDFAQTLNQAIIADFKTNPIQTISTLVDYIGEIPVDEDGNFDENGTLTTIDFTRNSWEANAHTILLKPNPEQPEGGTDVMDTEADGAQELLDYMTNQIGKKVISQLNQKIKIGAGRAPQQLSQASRNASSKRRSDRENLNLLADLYYGTNEEIDTALENLRGLKTAHGAIKDIERTQTGVSVITEGGSIPFSFKAGEGGVDAPLKTVTEFIEGISTEFGINFSDAVKGANIKKGKSFNNSTKTFNAPIIVAATPKQAAASALNKLAEEMSGQGYEFATKLGYGIKKVSGGYKLTKGDQSVTVAEGSKPIINFIKADITDDELLEFYNRGLLGEVAEGNSMSEKRYNNCIP